MDKNKFGNYIKERRLALSLTQKELSEMLVIDVSAVSKWERGVSYPDITILPELCKALSVSEHELIESSNDTAARETMREAKKYKTLKDAIFYTFSACYAVAIVTCFIVNLGVNHKLSWFFFVLSGCVCGFTFMPTVTRFVKNLKFCAFIGSTFLSLFLLYLTCSIYTGNYWVWTATSATALGYFAFFAPVLFSRQKRYMLEEKYRKYSKYFLGIYSLGLFLLTVGMLFAINAYSPFNIDIALKILSYCFLSLLFFSLCELLPLGRLVKIGLDTVAAGGLLYGLNAVLNSLLKGGNSHYYRINFSDWKNCSDGNIAIIGLVTFLLVGVILITFGIVLKKRKK